MKKRYLKIYQMHFYHYKYYIIIAKLCFKITLFQVYYHGDPITVNVQINNETNKTVKKIKISGKDPNMSDQNHFCLYSLKRWGKYFQGI